MNMDQKTIATYDAKAQDYASKFDSGAKPGTHLSRFMAALPKGGDVLDLGCGPGGSAGHLHRAGYVVDAIDASQEMVRLARETQGVNARQATFDDVTEVAVYDGVWANFSLLHAAREDMPRHLAAIARSLRDGGHFHIGMKTGDGMKRDHLDRRYTYYTEADLTNLIRAAGFEILATDRGHEIGLAGTDDWWVVIMGKRTYG